MQSILRTPDLMRTGKVDLKGRFFIGEVKELDLDKKASRVRVFIEELHGESTEYPWFLVMRPVLRGAGNKSGWSNIPRVGSDVIVVFDGGNEKSGIVLGEVTYGGEKSIIQDEDSNEWGFADENNTKFHVDVKTGTLTVHHFGNTIVMDKEGNTAVTTPKNLTANVGQDLLADVKGTGTIKTGGDFNIEAGGAVNIKAGGEVTVNGSVINLN